MPYRNGKHFERASPLGHVPTVQHPIVKERLRGYQRPAATAKEVDIKPLLLDPRSLPQFDDHIDWVMAVDGSHIEEEIDPRFPSTRTIFIQVAGVLVNLKRLRARRGSFADPAAIADAQEASVFAGFLPSSNLAHDSGVTPLEAFRAELHHLFRTTEVNGRSLLQTLLEVEGVRQGASRASGRVRIAKCPVPECRADVAAIRVPAAGTPCPQCGVLIRPTDILRVHEVFRPYASNLEAAGRVVSVAEHLTVLSFLMHVAARQPTTLRRLACITDGPLALYGEIAPIKWPLLRSLQILAQTLQDAGHGLPMLVGIEKSGEFVDHARAIEDQIPPGYLMHLPNDYIARHIRFREAAFGRDTYYGRKWVYRTRDKRLLVITIPPLGRPEVIPYGRGGTGAGLNEEALIPEDYPTLGGTCQVLDRIGTRLFENAVIPVALAHHWAAFPLRTAGKVLKLHAEQYLGKPGPEST
jgi:hypothetical protein